MRRSAFESIGGFNPALYPNEENEFLERLRLSAYHLLYHPEARVEREVEKSLWAFLGSIFGYGTGRGKQTRLFPTRLSLFRVGEALLAGSFIVLSGWGVISGGGLLALPGILYGFFLLVLAFRFRARSDFRRGLLAAALVPLLHLSYSLGVMRGLAWRGEEKQPGQDQSGAAVINGKSVDQPGDQAVERSMMVLMVMVNFAGPLAAEGGSRLRRGTGLEFEMAAEDYLQLLLLLCLCREALEVKNFRYN